MTEKLKKNKLDFKWYVVKAISGKEQKVKLYIEKELVQRKMLNKIEINWINNYHKKVQKKLYRFMDRKEKLQLTKACSPI